MNYLLLGMFSEIFKPLKDFLNKSENDFVYDFMSQDKKGYEEILKKYNIDVVIASGFHYQKLTNGSADLRYIENYRFLIDICIKYNIKHLHIIENAGELYKECIKLSRDYKYREDDDECSNDLTSLNHLFIKKYAKHISTTTSLTITISRYNKILSTFDGFLTQYLYCQKNNKIFEYIEDNISNSYTTIDDVIFSVLKICNTNIYEVYNLPVSKVFTKTELLNYINEKEKIKTFKFKAQQLRNMPELYVLDDSKIKKIL